MYAVHIRQTNGTCRTYSNIDTMSVSGARILITQGGYIYTYRPDEIHEIKFMPNSYVSFKEEFENLKGEIENGNI